MRRMLILCGMGAALLAIGVAMAVAATNGGASARATVSVQRLGGAGQVLVDAKGRALYVNDQERGQKVLCGRHCVTFWLPLTVRGALRGGTLGGKLSVLRRPDGSRQVAFRGKRLYTFTLDRAGKVTGDGFRDRFDGHSFSWHVARPVGATPPATTPTTTPTYTYPGY